MLVWVHILFLYLLLHRFSGGELTEDDVAAAVIEFSGSELEANIKEWESDLAIMFYAPWCTYCKQLLPTWGTIASLKKDSKDILVGKFNCEASTDHTDICQELGVDRYPSVYFLGYGNFNQADKGRLFGAVKNPRVVRYVADLYPTAIYDWVCTMAFMSSVHRKWEDFVGMFTGNTRNAKRVKRLKERVTAAEKKTALVSKELERYKANEIFDDLEDHGDPFVLLSSLPPDEQNLPLRVCVGEMAEEYCRYYPAEKYCKIALECADQDLIPQECRPAECPFESGRGCKVVSTCMQTDVIRQYQEALAKTAAKATAKATSK